ncbi:8887_t:CDS:2 [Scutellospora calospora]|uniref:8887_t:CDS:1 n=1 Tax=Scutellospora calospora TaxID=85575 RepID=A0ACA9LSE3_9GLOM|nr:8887_t:CDS:2 [Scutellospora calospora]
MAEMADSQKQNEYAKSFMNNYVNFYGRKNNQEMTASAEKGYKKLTWEQRLAKKYYDKLFKEYCIAELKFYKEGKIALRWRTEKEVIIGKGQLTCASTRCSEKVDLKSWEVNFAYIEDEQKKNALVKIRLCPKCSYKLNYNKVHQEVKKEETSEVEDNEQHKHEKRKEKSYDSLNKQKGKSNVKGNTQQDEEFDKYFSGLFD